MLKAIGLTTLGFTLGGSIGLGVASSILVCPQIGAVMGGAICGMFLAWALRLIHGPARLGQWVAISPLWAAAGGVGGIAVFLLIWMGRAWIVLPFAIAGGVGGMFGGGATADVLFRTQLDGRRREILKMTLGWTIGGVAGGSASVLPLPAFDLALLGPGFMGRWVAAWATGGAVGGAIFGAIGSSVMFWQLDRLNRLSSVPE